MQAGARGYLLKGAEQDEIVGAIQAVVAGQVIFGPGVAGRVLDYFAAPTSPVAEPFPELTDARAARSSTCWRPASGRRRSRSGCSCHPRP